MKDVCGIVFQRGTFEDFQRYIKCQKREDEHCKAKDLVFPNKCSFPPCNRCNQGIIIKFEKSPPIPLLGSIRLLNSRNFLLLYIYLALYYN